MTNNILKNTGVVFATFIVLISCNDNAIKKEKSNISNVDSTIVVKEKKNFEFGFKLNDYNVIKSKVEKNQTFSDILLKQNIGYSTIHKVVQKTKGKFDIRKMQRNKNYTLLCKNDSLSTAEIMIYQPNKIDYIVFDLRDTLNVYSAKKEVVLKERVVSGIINSSLSQALDNQGVDYRVSNRMSEIFAWTIDFFRLQKGDYFKLIFDEKYINDTTYVGISTIRAAEFHNNGETFYSFYFDKGKFPEYFDENGKNLRKAFLKAPLIYGTFRISSKFGKRFHPVQHKWKVHLGTDYAAPTGTPIISTANGTVSKSGYTRGNGKYVKVRHNSTYSTQYLHMSRRAVKVGQTVKQGQVIGYVGQTGLATGPHVCYRFWKNGVQVNSQRQKLPDAKPINKDLKEIFLEEMRPMKKRLDNMELPVKFEAKDVNLEEDVVIPNTH